MGLLYDTYQNLLELISWFCYICQVVACLTVTLQNWIIRVRVAKAIIVLGKYITFKYCHLWNANYYFIEMNLIVKEKKNYYKFIKVKLCNIVKKLTIGKNIKSKGTCS